MLHKLLLLTFLSAACLAQDYEDYQTPSRQSSGSARYTQQEEPKQEPIAILKQINRHNEDGSYTYGYEGADGSFKIETKSASGEVKGKYGYVDESGKVKVVEYGANKYGFQPSGEGITVPPVNYNDVKEVDYEEEAQRYVQQPKQSPKAARPQSFNYAPPVVEKRRPVETSPAPQYYDYEEEAPVTQRPVQLARPKYAVPAPPRQPQFVNNPQEFANSFDFSYTPEQRQEKPQAQYQYDSRQPVQFPPESEASPAPAVAGRSEQFTLFSPASRADTYKPKFEQPTAQYAQQTQQLAPQSAYQRPSFAAKPTQSRSTSILDQLAKDPEYSLPQSSPALHDISFGYSL